MNNAWAKWDEDTGTLIEVSWSPGENTIEISYEIAESILLGKAMLSSYRVVRTKNGIELVVADIEETTGIEFWGLTTIDNERLPIDILIDDDKIIIKPKISNLDGIVLFVTAKNDPSWLISSWELSTFTIQNGLIILDILNASSFSFYVSKGHEI